METEPKSEGPPLWKIPFFLTLSFKKKVGNFFLTWGGRGSPLFPTYFINNFVKEKIKLCFLIVLFCEPSQVKITPKNQKFGKYSICMLSKKYHK